MVFDIDFLEGMAVIPGGKWFAKNHFPPGIERRNGLFYGR